MTFASNSSPFVRRYALLPLGLAACVLSGCAKSGSNANNATSASTTTTASTDTTSGSPSASTPATGKGFKLVYIPKNTGNSYFDSVITGFKTASSELGYDFTTVAPATADAASQIPFIKEQVQRGVNVIAISPNSTDAVVPALKQAMAKGVKVITIDADLDGHEDARNAMIYPADFSQIGKNQIELISGLIGGKGDIAILSSTTDAPNQNNWIAGMKATLKDPKYKDIALKEVVYGDDLPEKSQREAQGLLTKWPNLKGIIAPTTVGIAATAGQLERAQAAGRVQLTGLGLPNQMRKSVEKGTVQKFALWDPAKMGYVGGYIAAGLVKGDLKPAPGVSFKAGTSGTIKFGPKNAVNAGPLMTFDRSNIDKYNFG